VESRIGNDFEELLMDQRFREAKRGMRENDPPIEVGQVWVSYPTGIRRMRILAKYPAGGEIDRKDGNNLWIVEELKGALRRLGIGELRLVPEFNLRYICKPEEGTDGT